MSWLSWELKRELRSRTFLFCSVLLCLLVSVSFVYGRRQIQRQLSVIEQLENLVTESDQVYFQERFKEDETVGRACYYLSQPTAHRPLPEAALSLGQRDLHSYHQSVRLRSLYANLFDSGFSNPSQAAAGHFDLAFVLVFLLPLFVIALTFDTLSADGERRTLPLLRAAGTPLGSLVKGRLLLKFALLGGLTSLLVGGNLWACGAPGQAFLVWIITTLSYLLFWFALAGFVCSRGWNSARNAGALLACWTFFTILGPSLLNLNQTREATKNGASITIRARQVINDGWDIDKEITAAIAEKYDPRYGDAPVVQEKFSWSWYFAMHDAGDAAVKQMTEDYFEGLNRNYESSLAWSFMFPPVRLQLILDEFSGTDLLSHLDYYRFVEESREKMREKLLPRVFSEETLTKKELLRLHQELPMMSFQPSRNKLWTRQLKEFIVLSLFLAVMSAFFLGTVERSLKR